MKRAEVQKLKEKNKEDLMGDLHAHKDALWKLKVDLAAGKVKNVRDARKFKKTIAIINTILNEQ